MRVYSFCVLISWVMNCLAVVVVQPFDESIGCLYTNYVVRYANRGKRKVIYVDSPLSESVYDGAVAELSFESGAMFLDGNIIMMTFPTNRNADTGYFLDASVMKNSYRYSSSGYELGESEPFTTKYGTTILVDPILFYSQNSHLICGDIPEAPKSTSSSAFQGHSHSSPVLLLMPDFPWLVGCTRVKLINMPDSRSREVRNAEFSPTGLYSFRPQEPAQHYRTGRGQQRLYSEQPPSQLVGDDLLAIAHSDMFFTVECQAEDQCSCHGRLITLSNDGSLTVIGRGRRSQPFTASIIDHKLVVSGEMRQEIYLQFMRGLPGRVYLRAIKMDEISPETSNVDKIVENFWILQSDTDTIQYLAIGRHIVWMLCGTKIVPIKGTSNPDCLKIMVQAHPANPTQQNASNELNSMHNLHHIQSESELALRANAESVIHKVLGKPSLARMQGSLGFGCIFKDAKVNFPCGGFNVDITVPGVVRAWKSDWNYLWVNGNQNPGYQRVMVTAKDGRACFQVDDASGTISPKMIQEENEFLNLSHPFPGKGMEVTVYEWESDDHPHHPANTMATIMAIGDTFIFYLCREVIEFDLMYFILLKPRVQSSLCTLVYMFIRPEHQHDRAPARLNQARNILVPSAKKSIVPNFTRHSASRFAPNNAYHSSESSTGVNIQTHPHSALGAQIAYPLPHSTAQLNSEQYSHGYEFNRELINQFNGHHSAYVSPGHPIHPQQRSPNDHFNLLSTTTTGNIEGNLLHQPGRNMHTQHGAMGYSELVARMHQYANYHNRINSGSQASGSNAGPYVPFVDPFNNPLDIHSRQSFQNSHDGQASTDPRNQ